MKLLLNTNVYVNKCIWMEGCCMSPIIIAIIMMAAVLADYLWFDMDRKRWGWMNSWSKLNKALFFSSVLIVSALIYFGLSVKYF